MVSAPVRPDAPVRPVSPLRLRMQQIMFTRNYSPRTVELYLSMVAKFAAHFGRSPDLLGPEEILAYQVYVRDVRKVSYVWFRQAMAALRFFYTVVLEREHVAARIHIMRREKHLPIVLSPEELIALLQGAVSLRDRLLLTVTYSAGLRLGETRRLTVADIDSSRMLIHIRQGKGHKDRYAPLSPLTLDLLRAWWRATRPVGLLFPSPEDPTRPLHHSTVQRAMRIAAKRAGITKKISPRTLRHSFATHLMEQGTSMRVIQTLLGHAHLRTTEIYTHVSPDNARSPLDKLGSSRD